MTLSKFDYSVNDASILTWHYRNFLRIDEEYKSDFKPKSLCRYCGAKKGKCSCAKCLKVYWEAAQLLALVMPSSGAAERVFSLLNNNLNEKQTRTLTDMIFLSLYLSYNER